ncbi:unnamed protein product [Closterium sp. NIES-53]
MMMVPGTRESLDEDSITSYILQDEALQEAEQPTELLPQVKYAALTKMNLQQGQCRKPSEGGRSTEDVNEKRSIRDKGCGGGGQRRECWICHDPDHLSYECPDRDDSDEDDTKGGRGRSSSRRPRRDAKPLKEKQTSKKMSSTKDVDISSGKNRGDGEASCSMVSAVEPTVSLALEGGEDFQAVAAAMQANPMAVLLDSGCSHHLMGTKAVFVHMAPSDSVKHVHGFNGALQPVEGRRTVALQGEAGKRVLIPDVLYVPGIQANLLSAGQLKESRVQLKGNGDEMLLVAATGGVLGRARYTGRVLCTDLRPCSTRSQSTKVVALRTIIPATKSTPDRLHARLAHVTVDTIKSSAQHEVAIGLDITPSTGADPPCISCLGGKLARHTFLAKGSDAEEALAVVHIDLCGPFRVVAKDGSLYFLMLKDRYTRFVWVMPVAKKSDVLREFQKWLVLVERQAKKSVLMLRSDRGGEFLGKEFTDFREMRTAVESVQTMLLHMGVQHHWWHLALQQAVWVRNCLERSTTPPRTTPYQLLTRKKPDLTLARVWGCMVQFMVFEQQCGGKLAPKARWGLHLGVSLESKGWEVLDLTNNKVVTSVEVIFYETLSLELMSLLMRMLWRSFHLPRFLLLPSPASTPVSATDDEGSLEASPVAPASGIVGGRQGAKLVNQDGKPSTTREQQTGEPVKQEAATEVQLTRELPKSAGSEQLVEGSKQLFDDLTADEEGELPAGEESTDSDVAEVPITKPELRRTSRARRPPERLSFHACLLPAAFTAVYDEDIATMTVKEALASWKGEAVERPRGVNIMKNRWVLMTKYRIDDTVEREKARLVVKGFTQVCGADYDETYSTMSSYVTLRIFLIIVAVFDLNLMQLDMKNTFLKSKLDRVLYMYQPDYFGDGTGRGTRRSAAGRWLEEEPGRRCALLQGQRQRGDLLREISSVIKYLGLEIVCDRPAKKLWLHEQGYADKLRRRFINEEQGGRVPKGTAFSGFQPVLSRHRPSSPGRRRACTAVFYGATLDNRSAAALAHRRPAVLPVRLSAVLARLLYATLAGGRPCSAVRRPG